MPINNQTDVLNYLDTEVYENSVKAIGGGDLNAVLRTFFLNLEKRELPTLPVAGTDFTVGSPISAGDSLLLAMAKIQSYVDTALNDYKVWKEVKVSSGTNEPIQPNVLYISDNPSTQLLFDLQSGGGLLTQGDRFAISGKAAGGWRITQKSGQKIHLSSSSTTTGVAGYIESGNQYDCIEVICVATNEFVVRSYTGSPVIV